MMTDKGWLEKEKRDIFSRICMTFIAKTGADKDPVISVIMKMAQEITDKAFSLYPNEKEENKETDLDFKSGTNNESQRTS